MYVRSRWVRRVCACAGCGVALAAAAGALLLLLLLLLLTALEPRPPSPLRHLPSHYWGHRLQYPHRYQNSGCVYPPAGPQHVQRASPFWQRVSLSPPANGSAPARALLAYAAYWDERHEHVTVLIHVDQPPPPLQCFFWYYDSGVPVAAPAHVSVEAGMARCAPPSTAPRPAARRALAPLPPATVSLAPVSFHCGRLHNMISIQLPEDARPNALGAVCVCAAWARGGGDAARRLLEWLALLQRFGVQRVHLYLLHAHTNVYRVLEHYRQLVQLMPYASPPPADPAPPAPSPRPARDLGEFGEYIEYGEEAPPREDPEAARRRHSLRAGDLTPYNDCLLRARPAHDWALLLDLDEILLPVKDGSYARMVHSAARAAIGAGVGAGGALPDVITARRYWFPQLLQRGLPPPPRAPPGRARAPPHLPPGRLFSYLWRAPTPIDEEMVTGILLQTGSVDHIEANGPVCRWSCVQWESKHDEARLHWYPARCGGRARGVCRALRARARRDALLLGYGRARAAAGAAARLLRLRPHSPAEDDDD